jgi:hypothetical protein
MEHKILKILELIKDATLFGGTISEDNIAPVRAYLEDLEQAMKYKEITVERLLKAGFRRGSEFKNGIEYYIQKETPEGWTEFYLWHTEKKFITELTWTNYEVDKEIELKSWQELKTLFFLMNKVELEDDQNYYDNTMRWVKLSDKLPTVEDQGVKVLLYRIMNEDQKLLGITIYDTAKVKHCNPNETWWLPLPDPPNTGKIKKN